MTATPIHLPAAAVSADSGTAQLRRLRWAVRAVLTLGVAASIAANILHAQPSGISRAIAAWPPLALLLTVELISRVPVHRRSLALLRLLATTAIAGIAWVSYWHMAGVAARYGETDAAASYLLPISVDGLVVVASISLVEIAGRIRTATTEPGPSTAPIDATPAPIDGPEPAPMPTPTVVPAQQANPDPAPCIDRDAAALPPLDQTTTDQIGAPARHEPDRAGTPSVATDRDDGCGRQAGDGDESGQSAQHCSRLPYPDPPVTVERVTPADDEPVPDQSEPRQEAGAPGAQPPKVGPDTGDENVGADEAVPADTAAAVAYWYRREPSLHPADIAAKIGRSERTVRRYWPPAPERGVNGHETSRLADGLRSA